MGAYLWVISVCWTLVAAGVVVFRLAHRIGRRVPASDRCLRCAYDLSATPETCPECDAFAENERERLRRRQRRQRRAARWLGVLMLLLGSGGLVFNPTRDDGWASSVPNWVIWPLMPWFDPYLDLWPQPRTRLPYPSRWYRLVDARRSVLEIEAAADDLRQLTEFPPPADRLNRPISDFGSRMREAESPLVIDALLDLAEGSGPVEKSWVLGRLGTDVDVRERRRIAGLMPQVDGRWWVHAFELLRDAGASDDELWSVACAGLDHAASQARMVAILWIHDRGVAVAQKQLATLERLMVDDPDSEVRAAAKQAVERIRRTR